jgi:hypothetical protein
MRLILVTVILTLISGNTEAAAAAPADAPQTGQPNLAFVTGGNPDGHRSWLALELSPLGPFVGHFGGAIELVPMPHHALVLAGYYMPPFGQSDPLHGTDSQGIPVTYETTFSGFGGEVGYRYYFGTFGPHGLFIGPSLLLGSYRASLQRTNHTVGFANLGGALDLGYQAIISHVVLALGAGVQYVTTSGTQLGGYGFPIGAQTSGGCAEPRVLASIGYAL